MFWNSGHLLLVRLSPASTPLAFDSIGTWVMGSSDGNFNPQVKTDGIPTALHSAVSRRVVIDALIIASSATLGSSRNKIV